MRGGHAPSPRPQAEPDGLHPSAVASDSALAWLDENRPETLRVEAEVLEGNLASQRTFLAAGFEPYARMYRRMRA